MNATLGSDSNSEVEPPVTQTSRSSSRLWWSLIQNPVYLRSLHVIGLCAFAFTQPLLIALFERSVYRHDQRFTAFDYFSLLFVLMIVLPGIAVLLDICFLAASKWTAGYGRNSLIFVLGGLITLSLVRPMTAWQFFYENSCGWIFSLLTGFTGATVVSLVYERSKNIRQWLTIASVGILVFPGSFILQLLWATQVERLEADRNRHAIQKPIPVVMIVFDEFSGTTLMDENQKIDGSRYPNFAKLASMSTWFRNSTTVHPRTTVAIPAMLTGRFPTKERAPLEAEHPGNLLSEIYRSDAFELTTFEPVTRIAPKALSHIAPAIEKTPWQRKRELLGTMAVVYPRLVIPRDAPIELPMIPQNWLGMSDHVVEGFRFHLTQGNFNYGYDDRRHLQVQHVLNCIKQSEKPVFLFAHIALPHYLWEYFPSGKSYVDELDMNDAIPPGGLGEFGESWLKDAALIARNEHRYLLQVEYVDQFIGKLLDRLKISGILDECLLIVTADHGVSFRVEHSRRVPDAGNMADILSVPLFIKRPGQTEGKIDDRNVESVDLFPTVADEIGMKVSETIDGTAVWNDARRPRKMIFFDGKSTIIEPRIPKLNEAIQRRISLFGKGSIENPPRMTASRPNWHGRPVSRFSVQNAQSSESNETSILSPSRSQREGMVKALLINGFAPKRSSNEPAQEYVIAVNGIIRDSCRAYPQGLKNAGFTFLLPESTAKDAPEKVELFRIGTNSSGKKELLRLHQWTVAKSG